MRLYLKLLRKKNNLTQNNLAEKLNIAPNYYCMIENGERQKKMDINFIQKLAAAFNVSVDYIIAEEMKLHTC